MQRVLHANDEIGTAALDLRSASEQGTLYMAGLLGQTSSMEELIRAMTDKVGSLSRSAGAIHKVLELLHNLTQQTNILSLNAAIEASRAGAAGKGFMVVADEIRNLADQTKQSIDRVGTITSVIQQEIAETVELVSGAFPTFRQQISSVKEADAIFRDVSGRMDEFSGKLTVASEAIRLLESSQLKLNETMSQVSAVAQQSSATSEEVASLSSGQTVVSVGLVNLSEQLDEMAAQLELSLRKFKLTDHD